MTSEAIHRLLKERQEWRRNYPFGFVAKPSKNTDGSMNMMIWDCFIPGKKGTAWEKGKYPLQLTFKDDYPNSPPKCKFLEGFFHLNVFADGTICISTLDERGWRPSTTIKQLLYGIQDLLNEPNIKSPVQHEAYLLYSHNREEYNKTIKAQAKAMEALYGNK